MATGLANCAAAARTMGRGRPQRWLVLSNRSLFRWVDGKPAPSAYFKKDTFYGGVQR